MNHCIELDWPKLSDAQHQEILNFAKSRRHEAHLVSFFHDKDIEFYGYQRLSGQEEFFSKILHTNHRGILKHSVIGQLRSINDKSPWSLEPHQDGPKFGLFYPIEGPGESIWYEFDQPLTNNTSYLKEFEQGLLKETQRFKMKLHTWYLYDHNNIHSVVGCHGTRTSVQIPLQWAFDSWDSAVAGIDDIQILNR